MTINKNAILFQRNGEGNLISREVELDALEGKPTVKIIPLTRGKLNDIYSKAKGGTIEEQTEADTEILRIGLVEPKLTDDEISDLMPQFASAITTAILAASLGLTQKQITDQATQQVLTEADKFLKKN